MGPDGKKAGWEPIPGYPLRKRIGAGGYGEVWLADAPGGLQKAVKLIFGAIDESQAMSELSSLQRMKEISHPFLLSLERIEIVDGQAVIVTELAEGSLLDRFQQYKRRGEPGIPRSVLLEFLHDTGDGLDFLSQKHNLQHLDVKPGNLLIIADRVKVADFGLVKDLGSMTQSMVSGLTPTYSAPEIFDGRPDHRSDQYSLAIVYIEMLTGSLPFNGKNTGEIARQHLSQPPNLDALPPADRPVVARALAKNPLDRFSSCKQFIEQLQKVRGGAVPIAQASTSPSKSGEGEVSKGQYTATQCTAPIGGSTDEVDVTFVDAIEVAEATQNYIPGRCVFVGLGGLGGRALQHVRVRLEENVDSRLSASDHGWLAIDSDSKSLEELLVGDVKTGLLSSSIVRMPVYKPAEYRDAHADLMRPISRRWMYNIPKSQRTEGVRPIAILAMLDHYEALRQKLREELEEQIRLHDEDEESQEPLRIYVMSSTHGGTGGGLLCEIGILIRQILASLNFTNYRLMANVTLATSAGPGVASMSAAGALACFSELHYLMNPNANVDAIYYRDRAKTFVGRPFDWVTVTDGGLHGSKNDKEEAVEALANTVIVDGVTALSAALAERRSTESLKGQGWLRAGLAVPIELVGAADSEEISRACIELVIRSNVDFLSGYLDSEAKNARAPGAAEANAGGGDFPLTKKATDGYTMRLLSDLGVVSAEGGLESISSHKAGKEWIARWARRLANDATQQNRQLQDDLQIWKAAIEKTINVKMYNWKQIEQIQLGVIEGIIQFCEKEIAGLATTFEPFAGMLQVKGTLEAAAGNYLKLFSEKCIQMLSVFQRRGQELNKKYTAWLNSIAAERQSLGEESILNPATLAAEQQTLVERVQEILNSKIQAEVHSVLEEPTGDSRMRIGEMAERVERELKLPYVLSLARELVTRFAEEDGIDFSKSLIPTTYSVSISHPSEVRRCSPKSMRIGGEVTRVAITPYEQSSAMGTLLKEQGIDQSTAMLPGPSRLGAFIACEGVQNGFARTLSETCRPTPQTLQLAERLRTRVDVDWPPIGMLFESLENELEPASHREGTIQSAASSVVNAAAAGGALPSATGPVSNLTN
ncbi:MAG: serine/threonine protein kinase [Pirellulaceae bacterium]